MQAIPKYPHFSPIQTEFKPELHPLLANSCSGISEFTFTGLYLFRNTYRYQLSWLPESKLLIRGEKDGSTFYSFPLGLPSDGLLRTELISSVDYLKNLSDEQVEVLSPWFEEHGYSIREDRDNFDYIYLREELAELRGRKYHKKRNLVNAFAASYTHKERSMDSSSMDDAYTVLQSWFEDKGDDGDYEAAREALRLKDFLELDGYLVYANDKPAAYAMGESLDNGRIFVIHLEKALPEYKGIYQFLNQAFALALPPTYQYINREQDLGNEGLRQAKMTYRPHSFIKKYRVSLKAGLQVQSFPLDPHQIEATDHQVIEKVACCCETTE